MNPAFPARLVFDPEVVLQGVQQPGSAAGVLVDAWLAGLLVVLMSDALAYATAAYLLDNYPQDEWQPVRRLLSGLLARARFVPVRYSWRATKPDHADHPVVNCAMNGAGIVVAAGHPDYEMARQSLGLAVATPLELVELLAEAPRSP
jgi:hypothetical protein